MTERRVWSAERLAVKRWAAVRGRPSASTGAPSMNVVLGVKVPPKGDHPKRSELQLRKGDQSWGGSRERNRGPMNKNRIQGDAWQGERA